MKSPLLAATALALAGPAALMMAPPAAGQMTITPQGPLRPDQQGFFALYKELVETDTSVTTGDCTRAAAQIAARMRAAGFTDAELTPFSVPEHPKEGGLVAVLPGTSKTLKPMLLLAHIDVVVANRADWEREPYKLVEENGYYYARGILDDKFQAAVYADTLIRLKQQGFRPQRSIKLALTCGEETDTAFNGAEYLARERRDLIDAEFALNEGGGGRADGKGKLLIQTVQVGEKVYQDYRLTVTNPGGHSSQPVPANAIYDMGRALERISAHVFPAEFNDTTRVFFTRMGAVRGDETGAAMVALTRDLNDSAAMAVVNKDRALNSMLRTTCVATMIEGGHAVNALPQRVEANVNCRIFPGRTPAEIKAELTRIIANPAIRLEFVRDDKPLAKPPALDPRLIGPMERLAQKHFPGVPVIPAMSTGATDAVYTGGAGIPTYGVPGAWTDPDGNGIHGLNERLEVKGIYTGRDYLFDLIKVLADTR
ncbi:M20/M25/M40 family metallo-hydrolase [Qipengyuania sediminis]|uniref:M20/M25/M40 family metallo-hydrolase n=1 Tax=Qipengyuania sediminis TaxID=1532023 RepID=UPI00105A4A91|nr:M20/M25/M40 family metallo-hydrolase [Qipengyuania sediminis]